MTSRQEILSTIRRNLPQAVELPELDGPWIRYADPVAQFRDMLTSVGGECFEVDSVEAIPAALPEWQNSGTVVSCVPGLWQERFDLSSIRDPHELEHVDLSVLPGHLAVAENGAVWVNDQGLPHRVLFFLAQHTALVVPRRNVVSNLFEAYGRIDPARTPFGCFISGPSKTADIEQSLVKGAHGARTMKVFLVEKLS